MPTNPKAALRAEVRTAQERYEAESETARNVRRQAFAKAQRQGLSLRDIANVVGLHHSRVGQIIEGK
jgi:DNA-directed RNA polymerase specialized sigma24 family protein